MIKSLNNDPFDAVFFLEEEFNKISSYNKLINYDKLKTIQSILNLELGWPKDTGFDVRESYIMHPFIKGCKLQTVYFLQGPENYEELIEKVTNPIIYFPSADTEKGSVIILETFFNYFFILNPKSNFIMENNTLKFIEEKDDVLISTQISYIKSLSTWIKEIVPQTKDVLNKFWLFGNELSSLDIDSLLIGDLSSWITLTSIRRYMKQNRIVSVSDEEFNEQVFYPFLCAYLRTRIIDPYIFYTVTSMIKLLESQQLRETNNTGRWIALKRLLNLIKEKFNNEKGETKNVSTDQSNS